MRLWSRAWALAAAVLAMSVSAADAQSPAEFYKGKTVDIYIGFSAGGAYDGYARLLARHMGKHIPGNPAVVPRNMEGAGSLRLANWLYSVAPKDGTVFGAIGRGVAFDPVLGRVGGQFEATRFTWIGSANDEVSICAAWHATPVDKLDDLLTREMIVGGLAGSADADQFTRILNSVLGTRLKIITGYPGGNDITLAMERGEVQGRCGWSWSSIKATHPTWVDEKKIKILIQLSLAKHPDLPDVPLIMDLAKTDEQRKILRLIFARQVMGRPFLGPPDIPADRVAALRQAFMEAMKDPEFLAEAEKGQFEITPVSGAEIQKLVTEIYQTPKDVAEKAAAMVK